jgi:negative regulator of flagellin synthesis FlgM
MADIAPIPSHGSPLYGPAGSRLEAVHPPALGPEAIAGRSAGVERPTTRPSDRVELSDRARLLSKLAALPEIRQDLVDGIRALIAAGTLDTPERLDEALDAMISELE